MRKEVKTQAIFGGSLLIMAGMFFLGAYAGVHRAQKMRCPPACPAPTVTKTVMR